MAHQVRAGERKILLRSPENYATHVQEMIEMFGQFEFVVDGMLVDGDRAYARWRQIGRHIGVIDGYPPTGMILETTDSAVYCVADGLIVEYWIQPESAGLLVQLKQSKV